MPDDSQRPPSGAPGAEAPGATHGTAARASAVRDLRAKVLPNVPKGVARASSPASAFAPVCSVFRRFLRGKGLKFTPERAMVLDAVLSEEGLFDAEKVVANLKRQGQRGSRATVYRTLAHLHDAGILKQVFFDSTQTYYEVIAGGQTSDYLVCIETGRVVEFSSDRVRGLCEEICREFGFELVSHQLQIFAVASPEEAKGPGHGQ